MISSRLALRRLTVGWVAALAAAFAVLLSSTGLGRAAGPLEQPPGLPEAQAPAAPDAPRQRTGAGEPDVGEQTRIIQELYAQLAIARNAENANALAQAIERLWAISGSDTVDLLLARANLAMLAEDKDLALTLLGRSLKMAPRHAEAWNRRAAVYFADQRYLEAMADLNRALAIDPNHFKALQGAAVTLKELGRKQMALDNFRKFLKVHPYSDDARKGVEELEREIEGQKI